MATCLTQEETNSRVVQKIPRLLSGVSRVQRDKDGAVEQACQIAQNGFDGRDHVDGDAVSRLKVMLLKPRHGSSDPLEHVPVSVRSLREIQGHPVLPGGENFEEMLRQTRRLFRECAHGHLFSCVP